jgi:hypothetical protein
MHGHQHPQAATPPPPATTPKTGIPTVTSSPALPLRTAESRPTTRLYTHDLLAASKAIIREPRLPARI